jgi:hypothetical protein
MERPGGDKRLWEALVNPESGSILIALYAKGNPGKPVGSGWYLVNLNAGQCAAKEAGTFGCKFDASGNLTEKGPTAGLEFSL